MEIKEYVEKIVDNGNVEDMHELSEILNDLMRELCEYDEKLYDKYKMHLYKMAYGSVLSRDMAEEIVQKMRPYRMRWNFEETRQIQEQYGVNDIRPTDFFVVMNSAYNDYKDIFDENIEFYVRFTKDFINDEDAKDSKVFTYFTTIPY